MVTVLDESPTGRNKVFFDTKKKQEMTRAEFVKQIEQDKYKQYYVRKINGMKTPCSKPDKNLDNNLG